MIALMQRAVTVAIAACLLLTAPAWAGWREIRPVGGGAVKRIAADAQGTLYAVTNGGLLRSSDNGDSWQPAQGDLPTTEIGRVVPDPVEVGVVYVTTDQGLFRTLDGGTVWARLPLNLPAGIGITEMAVAPANRSYLFVATWGAYVYRSLDRGATWEQRAAGLSGGWGGPAFIASLAVDPINPLRVYTSTWRGRLFRSDDAASTWYPIADGGTWESGQMVVSRSHPNVLYMTHGEYWFGRGTVLRSSDYGNSWANAGRPADGFGVDGGVGDAGELAIDPTDPNVVYVTTSRGVHKTTTGGGTWSWLLAPPVALSRAVSLAVLPATPSTVLAGFYYLGFYRSTDSGGTWLQRNDGVVSADISGLDVCRAAPSNVYLTVQGSGPWRSADGGATWSPMGVAQGLASHAQGRIVVHPQNPDTINVASHNGTTSVLWRSQDGGVTFSGTASSYGPSFLAASPLLPERVFASVSDWQGGFLFSGNGGANWAISQWWYIYPQNYAFHPGLPNVVFSFGNQYTGHALGTKHILWSSTGNGTGWTSIVFGQGRSGGLVALDQNDPTTLYAATSLGSEGTQGIYKFHVTYSGSTVASVVRVPGTFNSGLTNTTIRDLVYDSSTAALYASTPGGVFRSRDQAATWEPLNAGLPYLSTGFMAVVPATATSEAKLLVATNGGLWEYGESTPVSPVAPVLSTSPAELLQKVVVGTVATTSVTAESPVATDVIDLSMTTPLHPGMSFAPVSGNPALGDLVFSPGGNQRGQTYRVGLLARSTLDPTKQTVIDRYFTVIRDPTTDAAALISTNTGGSLQTPDGGVTLTIPVGAIPAGSGIATVSMISLNQTTQASIYVQFPQGQKLGRPSSVYAISIDSAPHYTFDLPVALTFTYAAGRDPAAMVISVYDATLGVHVPVTDVACLAGLGLTPVTGSAATGGTVSVCTAGLSTWALSDISTFVDVPSDVMPPTLEVAVSPAPNAAGWNREDVALSASASDEPGGSGLAEITCVSTGVQPGTICAPTALQLALTVEGDTQVSCVATDNAGNSSTPVVRSVRLDKTAPVVQVPAALTVEAAAATGALVAYEATAADALDPHAVVTCAPASGSLFALATTTVTCTATDAAGNSTTDGFAVSVVDSTPPVLNTPAGITTDATSVAGAPVTYSVSASDAVDATPVVSCRPASGSTFAIGATTVTCSASDAAGNSATASFAVSVVNRPPSVSAGGPYSVDEGGAVLLTAWGSDPENGPLMLAWDLDGDGVFETAGASVMLSAAGMDGPGTRSVAARATDSQGAIAVALALVEIRNAPPVAAPIVAPLAPARVQAVINVGAAFSDPGAVDTHVATWDWGDGTASSGSVTEADGDGMVTGTHSYLGAGVYTITLTLVDDDGWSTTASFDSVVVFDPDAGHVTGGGWILSPAGAYLPQPGLIGKAAFGFVSRYQQGAAVPTGNTQFHLNAGGMKFQSTTYEWLVVAGPKARYKGVGTINGAGTYGFVLTAADGQADGMAGIDKLRVKIWDHDSGNLVYDNQPGAMDDAPPSTPISGGSIVIHTR